MLLTTRQAKLQAVGQLDGAEGTLAAHAACRMPHATWLTATVTRAVATFDSSLIAVCNYDCPRVKL